MYATLIVILFFGSVLVARLGGFWQNEISLGRYREYIPILEQFDHARGGHTGH
jgi:hypothetical protein